MQFFTNILFKTKNYCLNSTLAGLSYVADSRFHLTERTFWFSCLLLSIFGSYYLILQTLQDFDGSSVNTVVESLHAKDLIHFPSVGVCEIGIINDTPYSKLEQALKDLPNNDDDHYNFDVEDFLLRLTYLNLYSFRTLFSYCDRTCDECAKCPKNNYSFFAELARQPCPSFIIKCIWNNVPFDCCKYFLPIQTSLGRCFLLNSIQTTTRFSDKWFPMIVGKQTDNDSLILEFAEAATVAILNEEDVPHVLLTKLQFSQQLAGSIQEILFKMQTVRNDEGVEDISSYSRKCIFPDENFDSFYNYYSYSTCVTECLKRAQIRLCNCTHFNMIYNDKDKSPQCDYDGMSCLDKADMVFPQTTIMQPWRTTVLDCGCLPSCNEHEIKIISRKFLKVPSSMDRRRITRIILPTLPSQRYRRQSVRTHLDIVVSIGGALGLFLGASILSAVEFLYFFALRTKKNAI